MIKEYEWPNGAVRWNVTGDPRTFCEVALDLPLIDHFHLVAADGDQEIIVHLNVRRIGGKLFVLTMDDTDASGWHVAAYQRVVGDERHRRDRPSVRQQVARS